MTITHHHFDDFAALETALVARLARGLSSALSDHGKASLVCAGGTTPLPLYETLSHAELDWSHVWAIPSDERWAGRDTDASNERNIRAHLGINHAKDLNIIPFKTDDATPEQGAPKTEAVLAATWPGKFDITVLGMGDDGHTASLYPNAPGLLEALDTSRPERVRAVQAKGAQGSEARLTLTLKALLNSEVIIILTKGASKKNTFQWASGEGGIVDAPVRAILRQSETPVEWWWAP